MATVILLLSILGVYLTEATDSTYRAAVVEYEPPSVEKVTLNSTLLNAYVLAKYAMEGRWEGVDILVFPEYGLTGFVHPDRENGPNTYAQDIPDPEVYDWNPCTDPDAFENTEVLYVISCAARFNAMVIVANVISREPCNAYPDEECPEDGHFYFNTNVIFHRNGTLAGRYHKKNLFLEPFINPAPHTEYTIVDVGFAKLACFICFDITFHEPAITLIKKKGIRNFVFTTAWINILPFITAPQLYASFSRGLRVNLIAANHHDPSRKRLGSGIFSASKGALNQTYDLASSSGKMIIADVPLNLDPITPGDLRCNDETHYDHSEEVGSVGLPLTIHDDVTLTDQPSSLPIPPINEYFNLPLKDFTIVYLKGMEDHVDLCKNDFCCHFDYEFLKRDDTVYALAVHDGVLNIEEFLFGAQACALLRCEAEDPSTCGRVPLHQQTDTTFKLLSISATFNSEVILPQILGTDLQLVPAANWTFHLLRCNDEENGDVVMGKLQFASTYEKPIMSASLLGRIFKRDSILNGKESNEWETK